MRRQQVLVRLSTVTASTSVPLYATLHCAQLLKVWQLCAELPEAGTAVLYTVHTATQPAVITVAGVASADSQVVLQAGTEMSHWTRYYEIIRSDEERCAITELCPVSH